MSYDFAGLVDTGGHEPHCVEPYFSDTHPAFDTDGMAGTAVLTTAGYARCGNYTSNVSRMWTKCLTAALDVVPDARRWVDASALAFNASGRTRSYLADDGEWVRNAPMRLSGTLGLGDLAGLCCADIAPVLRAAVEWGVEHIDELRDLNPTNGWGNAEGAVTYLWDIQRFCEVNPKCDLYISR